MITPDWSALEQRLSFADILARPIVNVTFRGDTNRFVDSLLAIRYAFNVIPPRGMSMTPPVVS